MNVHPQDVQWVRTKIIKTSEVGPVQDHVYEYELNLPHFLASWDVWDYWERERLSSMKKNLKKGDVLYDIGAETGWLSVLYAQFVGAENMVLVEPAAEFWPNIYRTWKANHSATPRKCYQGLFSDKDVDKVKCSQRWPASSKKSLVDNLQYQYIHEHAESVPEVTLDKFVEVTGVVPDALTIDTEGSELLVLRGSTKTLKKHKPLVWVSIHPDLSERHYKTSRDDLLRFMYDHGYKSELLGVDHEEHWLFR